MATGTEPFTAEHLARAIDVCLRDRVLVFGSPPARARDLDLLARAPELAVIASALSRRGFVRRGVTWASFSGCAVVSVDLVPAESWALPAGELGDLFAEAQTIDGLSSLVIPSPHHQLLIVARRAAREGGTLADKARSRVESALAHDPAAWNAAGRRAAAWRARAAMRLLGTLLKGPAGGAPAWEVAARGELALTLARTPEGRRRLVSALTRPRRAVLVAFSGLDGAGKSFQADALSETLGQLGVEAFVVWPPAQNVLFQMPGPIKAALRNALARAGSPATSPVQGETSSFGAPDLRSEAGTAAGGETDEPVFAELPRQRPLVTHALATVVALVQALSFWRAVRSAPRCAPVVIFDRYVLDAIVYVRHRWGHGRPLRLQCLLIRALARRPLRAYLLDVPADVAYGRKRDFPLEDLRARAELYREHWRGLGARRLDGQRGRGELCEEIASEVWSLLR